MMQNLGLPQCWRCIHPVGVIRKSGCIWFDIGSQCKSASLERRQRRARPGAQPARPFMEFQPIDIDRQAAHHRSYDVNPDSVGFGSKTESLRKRFRLPSDRRPPLENADTQATAPRATKFAPASREPSGVTCRRVFAVSRRVCERQKRSRPHNPPCARRGARNPRCSHLLRNRYSGADRRRSSRERKRRRRRNPRRREIRAGAFRFPIPSPKDFWFAWLHGSGG